MQARAAGRAAALCAAAGCGGSGRRSALASLLPLSRIDKRVSADLGELLAFYERNARSAPAFTDGASPPGAEHLLLELRWIVEDAVTSDVDWSAVWARAGPMHEDKRTVRCRCAVEDLQRLWEYRIEERVPIQYIQGVASWYDFELSVGPGCLIPRPETECLLDAALSEIRGAPEGSTPAPWLDLGTGSGALALGLARHGGVPVVAIDESDAALSYARANVASYGLSDRIQVLQGDWFEPLVKPGGVGDAEDGPQFGGILSNPPYVDQGGPVQLEVAKHEPEGALYATRAGLEDLERIARNASAFLEPGGFLGLESGGPEQAQAIADVLRSQGSFVDVRCACDLSGIERFILATKRRA